MAPSNSPYQVLGALRPEEIQALREDIAQRGVLVPVETDEQGNVLDGHHRAMIADELGIRYRKIRRRFDSERAKVEHALKLNLLRRNLGALGVGAVVGKAASGISGAFFWSWESGISDVKRVLAVESVQLGPRNLGPSDQPPTVRANDRPSILSESRRGTGCFSGGTKCWSCFAGSGGLA